MEHLKKVAFFKNNSKKKNRKLYVNLKKFQHLQFSFYSTTFVSFKTVFSFYVATHKKSAHGQKFFPPIGWCEFTPAWQNKKNKTPNISITLV